jgi:type IV pilus assembly protein PilY1
MIHKHLLISVAILTGAIAVCFSSGVHAQATAASNDDFTQASDKNLWKPFDGACLTAGDGTGSIPACVGLPYYKGQAQIGGDSGYLGQSKAPTSDVGQQPDPPGDGALRFTNSFQQAGSIISSGTPFPTGAGINVIFKTITYRGDTGTGGDGADGMAFFLMDGSLPPYDTGAFGGSLGYTCTNELGNNDKTLRADGTVRGFDGLVGGYIGLGIDEWGNFLNPADNTASGPGYQPGRIGLRGRGSISFGWLNKNFPQYYPSILLTTSDGSSVTKARAAVHDTCRTGFIWDYSDWSNVNNDRPIARQTTTPVDDYAPIGTAVVLSAIPSLAGNKIANEGAFTRNDAQPMTYNLKITQDGILSLNVSYNGGNYVPVITKQSVIATNGTLPGSFRFGFTGSTGGSTNVHELLCFQATPNAVAATSVGVNQQEATKIASGTQAYLAYYYPGNWTGRLTANDLVYTAGTNPTIGISSTTNWDASCNLTGVPSGQTCPTTGAGPSGPQIAPTNRTMLTFDGSQGVAFRWDNSISGSSISATQQNVLDAGDATPFNANRLNYLRGDQSNEIDLKGKGLFRPRDGILGDIIDSSPTWVGPPTPHYAAKWKDLLVSTDPTPENSGTQSFAQFVTTAQTRLNVVYTGANDGFMHGFRSGSFDVSGNYVNTTTPNDGQEVLAYMPAAVLKTIHNPTDGTLDYSGSQYAHNFFVDATPDVDDVFYQNSWHTWLVGGLGAGGAAVYMLDVTDPSSFSETNAKNIVMGDWSSATIGCKSDTTSVKCSASMGNTYGTPIVRRLHDGKWAVIFGNGFGSASGDAGIFIMLIDSSGGTQAANTYYLSTGKAGTNDGIASVSSADLDGDHITDYVYAGDLLGNVWRFDLTSASEGSWAASSAPLFSTPAGQPITTKVQVIGVPQGAGPQRLMIDFGTGQKFPPTILNPTTYHLGTQYLYGVWDWNMANWNSKSTTKYLSLSSGSTLTASNLTTQTLTPMGSVTAGTGSYDITSNIVCWSATTTCSSGNNQFGFVVALPGAQEQVVFSPLIYQNALIVNTTIPAVNSPRLCQVAHDTGYTIAISLLNGGSLSTPKQSFFLNTGDMNTAGAQTNGTGTPFIAQAGGNTFILTQSLGDASFSYSAGSSAPTGAPISCVTGTKICGGRIQGASLTSKRLTWIERR